MLSRSILISLLLLLMPVFLRAQTFTVGNHTYTVLSEEEKTVSLTSSTQTTGELIIPTEVTDDNGISYTVTKIGDRAFCDGSGVKYSGLTGTLVIPNSIKEIGDYAFAKCTGFTGLKFNDNLESIGNYAFAGESTSGDSKRLIMNFTGPLSFPRTLKKIGKRAFYNCYHLTGSITIPEDMELGEGIFVSCQGLNGTLTFEGVRETIPASFAYDAGFTEVNLPKGLKTIGGCAFVKNKFESIVLPETLETIEGQGFYLCEQLKSIKLPSSLTSLGLWAFLECRSLSGTIVIPEGITEIPERCFMECMNIEEVVLPEGLTSIGHSAFASEDNTPNKLRKINTPKSLKSIGPQAFWGCIFDEFTFVEGLTSIGDLAFANCAQLIGPLVLPASLKSIGCAAFCNTGIDGPLTFLSETPPDLPNGRYPAWYTFPFLKYNQDVRVPEGSIEAYKNAYSDKTGSNWTDFVNIWKNKVEITPAPDPVMNLNVSDSRLTAGEDLQLEASIANSVYRRLPTSWTSSNESIAVVDENGHVSAITAGEVTITAATIENLKLSETKSIPLTTSCKIKVIPMALVNENGIKFDFEIDSESKCVAVISGIEHQNTEFLVLPSEIEVNGVKYPVKRIAENAFKDNVVLKGLTIPNGITSIGANAFNGCSNLEKVTLLSEVAPVLGEGAFDEATYTKVELRVPDASKEKYTNNEAWNKFISILGLSEPISVKLDGFENLQVLINENEASEESGKARDVAGNSVTLVSVSPDENGKLIIPSDVVIDGVTYQVTTIGEGAFKDNTSLKEIVIPESVEKIGNDAFMGNTSLTEVSIPASVKEIGSGAFAECDNISKIISEPTVPPTLGEGAFSEKVLKNAEVRVNDESADAYRASEDWSKFGTLLGKSEAYNVGTEGSGNLRAEIREGEPGDNGEAAPRFVVIVSGAPDEDGKVIIPSEVEICGVSYPVKEIGEGAFKDNSSLKEIVIPESVEKIGSEAFKGNTSLTEVTIPASVKEIGSGAFAECDNIEKIISEPTVPPTLGEGAFSEKTLKNAEVRVNDESADAYRASEDWSKFGTLLGKSEAYSVETEGNGSLRAEIREGEPGDNGEAAPRFVVIVSGAPDEDGKVIIPSEVEICGVSYPVKEIGEGAFKDNSSLKEIVIPESVEKIGSEAFKGNTSLTEVTIPASVKEIGSGAFANCDNISKIISEPTVPPTLGEGAFSENTLRNAEVRVNDESAEAYRASEDWSKFGTLLGKSEAYSVESEGKGSLRAEIREGEPGDNGEAAPRFVVIVSGIPGEDGKVIIPAEVEICGVSYPVKEIGEDAFKDNTSLKEIVIPESVEKIGSEAFKGNTSLTEVTIPASVKEIGSGAFADCDNISKIISEPTVPPTLGEGAFSENTLRNAEVRVNDESADAYRASEDWNKFGTLLGKNEAYSVETEGNGSLRAEIREGEPGDNGEEAPRYVVIVAGEPTADGNINIPAEVEICGVTYPVKEIGECAFSGNTSVKEIVISESVEKIGNDAFKGNTSLSEVIIPASVKEIGSGAFADCDNIAKIVCEPTVPPTLGKNAFSEKTLKNAEVRVNDESADAYRSSEDWSKFGTLLGKSEAYNVGTEGSGNLRAEIREGEPGDNGEAAPRFVVIVSGAPDEDGKVIIPSEVEICGVSYPVKEIGEGAFKDNSSLKEIVIPESVEKIGSEAFKGNTSLTEVTIPASVKEIGSGAFAECDNIEKIISEPTVPPTLG